HARRDERRGVNRRSRRPALPGVDVPRVSAPRRRRAGPLMHALDQRLVRRARPVRILLGIDTGAGAASALLLLVQATLLAHVVAAAFDGADLAAVAGSLVLLVLVFAMRATLSWGVEL